MEGHIMGNLYAGIDAHPTEIALADFLSGISSKDERKRMIEHLSSCDRCLDKAVTAYEVVDKFNNRTRRKKTGGAIMKRLNIYLLLCIISFCLSFVMPRYFLQLLVATLLLGIKWVVDSKSTKMLIMIYEAWKRDGLRGASDILETLETRHNKR
jgi:Flp pilus assembly protein TadB